MSTVNVSNIAPQTTEVEIKEFFSYCGEFENFKYLPGIEKQPGTASMTFKRDTVAQTAALLDKTELNGLAVKVDVAPSISELAGSSQAPASAEELKQEDKPRAAIFAEYLSHGYVIGDHVLQKGIDLDNKHGISKKFSDYLTSWDQKLHPVDRARSVDETYKVTEKAGQAYNVLQQYFEKNVSENNKRKIRDFYTQTQKQVLDIHTEARRLADEKKGRQQKPAECGCTGTGNCSCAPGQCSCSNCTNSRAGGSGAAAAAPTTEKQTCGCSDQGTCTCAPGTCGCSKCGGNK